MLGTASCLALSGKAGIYQPVLELAVFGGMRAAVDGVSSVAKFEDRDSEGVTDSAGEFFRGMPAMVTQEETKLLGFGDAARGPWEKSIHSGEIK